MRLSGFRCGIPPSHSISDLAFSIFGKPGDADADTTALEREIDQLVYRLYGLTPEEIAIIEGNTPSP